MPIMAMTTPTDALAVSSEQLELVRRTVAKDATPDELALYLYDCHRQGVHPLDKLIHFTKRGGKYTPVTSIDFMRIRAADTGEMAGSDDAIFEMRQAQPMAATVTVYRLTQGQRFAYTGTARWSEYKPDQDFIWKKMPHVMLAKCAEAVALRKGFPRQLAGLYAAEELDQANNAPSAAGSTVAPTSSAPALSVPAAATGGNRGTIQGYPPLTRPLPPHPPAPAPPYHEAVTDQVTLEPGQQDDLPIGYVRLVAIDSAPTKNPSVTKYSITLSTGEIVNTINLWLVSLAQTYLEHRTPVRVKTRHTKYGVDLMALMTEGQTESTAKPELPLDNDIPF